jgi:hypothetical protein
MTPRLLALVAGLALAAPLAHADDPIDPPGRVARISAALGTVSLQPAGSDTWVSDVLNRPLTNDDRLWSDRESRAEVHVGSSAMRLGAETGVGILNIDDRTVHLRLSVGALQLRVRSLEPDETMEIATPSASIAVLSAGSYRIDVSDRGDELRVAVRQGQVAVTDASGAMTVNAGELAIFRGAVNDAVTRALPAGDGFDQWAAERDRREDRAVSTRYVSRDTIGYEDLDDYGTWRTVDQYGPVWVPQVAVGWTPYRDGHWSWIAPWGWTWIDDAPWGFAPSHYGRWIHYRDQWCWAPGPRISAPIYAPALVGWVGGHGWSVGIGVGGPPVGWFPLGWNEVFVPSYRYSRGYVTNINVTNIHVDNTYVTNYVDRGRPADHGNAGRDRYERAHFANMGVSGAVIVTSRDAFQGSRRIGEHLARLPAGTLDRARPDLAAPALAPTRESIGRPSRGEPPRREIFNRPVVSSTPAPAPAPSFETQRRGVVANGGRPLPIERGPMPRDTPEVSARPDPVRVIRGGTPQRVPTPGQIGPSEPRPLPQLRPGGETPRTAMPPSPPTSQPPPTRAEARGDRPPPGYRPPPPSEWRRDAAPPVDRAGPPDARPAPADRAAPDAQRPSGTIAPDRPSDLRPTPRPQVEPRPAPEPRPVYPPPPRQQSEAPARSAPVPEPAPRPTYEPRPAYQPPPRQQYEPPPRPAPAPEAAPRPAYEPRPAYQPPPRQQYEPPPRPAPAPEAAPRPAPQWSPPPAPPRESPGMREFHAPPPAPAPTPAAHPTPPPAEKPHGDKPQRDH